MGEHSRRLQGDSRNPDAMEERGDMEVKVLRELFPRQENSKVWGMREEGKDDSQLLGEHLGCSLSWGTSIEVQVGGEDGGFCVDLVGELEVCVLHALEPLGLRRWKQPGTVKFHLHLTSIFYMAHYWCFTEGFLRIHLISAENREGLRTNSCQN